MQVEQAMNEVIEFFSSVLLCLFFLKTVLVASERASSLSVLQKEVARRLSVAWPAYLPRH